MARLLVGGVVDEQPQPSLDLLAEARGYEGLSGQIVELGQQVGATRTDRCLLATVHLVGIAPGIAVTPAA